MPYVECIVMESLRMFGGRAFTVPHRALRDTWLNGYLIPKVSLIDKLVGIFPIINELLTICI